jgi:hypothetical protein
VPEEPNTDKQLQYAISFLRGSGTEATATDGKKQPVPLEKKADRIRSRNRRVLLDHMKRPRSI